MSRLFPVLVAALLLASCGGSGGPEPAVDGSALGRPQNAVAADACQDAGATTATAGYQLVDGVCTRTFAPMRSQASGAATGTSTGAGTGAATGALRAPQAPQAATALTWPTLLAWAERTYPQFFSGASQNGTYQDFTYRYYPSTGNYIGLRNTDMIYVLGPLSDDDLLYVGTMGALSCQADPIGCASGASTPTGGTSGNTTGSSSGSTTGSSGGDIPGDASTTARLAAGGSLASTIDNGSDMDWYAITLSAGVAYTFDLQGSTTGQGTLADPVLRLLNGAGQLVASNDDISYPSNPNSRIVYTPTSGGTYYLSAQAYSGQTGSYRLSAAGGGATAGATTGSTSGTTTGGSTGGTTGSTTTTSRGIRPVLQWEVSVTPAFYSYVLQLCYGSGSSSCDGLGNRITRDMNLNDSITSSGFADGIRWSAGSPVQVSALNALINGLTASITSAWSGATTPNASVVASVLNTALANGTSPADVASRATAGFARAGYGPSSGGTTGGTSGGGTSSGGGTTGGSCGMANYAGPQDDPQTWTICASAYSYSCNGDSTNAARTCSYLTGVLAAYGSRQTAAQYCSAYCR